ncbi:MAG: type phosphodiesterase/nucleotide pyrophosphatase [Planctomycetaceae bacterium]|nr:type phosphodiesterase/nucleotide pyrophosphatase [Planctomycetaceae bacterium]
MIVLGVDGMDPQLLQKYMQAGRMPNCQKLIQGGSFQPLQTSTPPQSPVAWSSFISGTNPGGHGIFDFIARDPATMQPYHSTARLEGQGQPLKIGRWAIPTAPGSIRSRRRGPTFWNELERQGIDCSIFRMPANFPPTDSEATSLSGMGTPDMQGGYGIFTYFTDDRSARTRDLSGGHIEKISFSDHSVTCLLQGPVNEFSAKQERTAITVTVNRDPDRPSAKIVVQDTVVVLSEGEWSDWIVVRFSLVPYAVEVSGICRLYLKSVREPFGLYVSPVNINPADPAVPISTPPDYSRHLVRELGYYYTQGMVEDTHALSAGVLNAAEYRQQAMFVHAERLRFFEHELGRFQRGFLFYYFSTLDLSCHVFWRTLDPGHPLYSRELAASQGDFLPALYEKVDQAIGLAMERIGPDDWLIVMSDHGFTSFRRQFNLNSWLLDEGYLRTQGAPARSGSTLFPGVDWSRTKAYGVGINSLYLNRQGRESQGLVRPDEIEALTQELITRLKAVKDPENGKPVIANVFRASDVYTGPHAEEAPDLILGYHPNYRASWDTILGGFPREHILDNTDAWSGDHCVDPAFVPGVLLSSRAISSQKPRIEDLAPTILSAFGVPIPAEMTGHDLTLRKSADV